MSLLYVTADRVGVSTGGGVVTRNEVDALAKLGEPYQIIERQLLEMEHRINPIENVADPWLWDDYALRWLQQHKNNHYRLCHLYAGTFSRTVAYLKSRGTKIVYTAAAHSIEASRKAHMEMGIDYAKTYPHLTNPEQWERYVKGYLEADVLVCPSQHSKEVMQGFGAKNQIEIIPHGCEIPKCFRCQEGKPSTSVLAKDGICFNCNGSGVDPIAPYPKQFRLGYLGQFGCDKGVIDLFRAWAKLNYKDALLVLGGRDSNSSFVQSMMDYTKASNVVMLGWVNDVSDFYNQISAYSQTSRSEGFGCEVLEAMAFGRPVICSDGAGAVDLIPRGLGFINSWYVAGNIDQLITCIDDAKNNWDLGYMGERCRKVAEEHTWDKIKQRYIKVWKGLLGE